MNQKRVVRYPLKISAEQVKAALAVLSAYVEERRVLIETKKVDDVTDGIKFMDAIYKFKEMVAEEVKSPAEKLYDAIRFTVLPNLMDENGVTSETVEGVGRCNLQDDVQVRVLDKDALHTWLKDQELEDMIKESVNAQTLSAFIRGRIKENGSKPIMHHKPLPDSEAITISPVVRAVITRSGV